MPSDDTLDTSAFAADSLEAKMANSLNAMATPPAEKPADAATGDDDAAKPAESAVSESTDEKQSKTNAEVKEDTDDAGADDDTSDSEPSGDEDTGDDAGETTNEKTQEEDLDPDFVEAMRKRGIAVDLADVPKEHRQLLLDKVKAMDAGYTRVRQDAAEFRKEKAEFDAAKTFQTTHPDQYIADLLAQDETLLDKVNQELERRQDPTYTDALTRQRDADAKLAKVEAAAQDAKHAELAAEVANLDAYAESAVAKAGIPKTLVEDALALLTVTKWQDGKGSLPTREEIDAVITRHADTYKRHVGAHKGATTRSKVRDYVADKQKDKDDAAGRGKPSGAASATDGRPPKPAATLEEKMLQTLDAIGVG